MDPDWADKAGPSLAQDGEEEVAGNERDQAKSPPNSNVVQFGKNLNKKCAKQMDEVVSRKKF